MEKVVVNIKRNNKYGVIIESGAIKYLDKFCENYNKVLIVSDEEVFTQYGEKLISAINKARLRIFTFTFPSGEESKSKHTSDTLLLEMTKLNLNKSDLIIAFGGGVASDVAGFSAGIFKRGIPYINVPTTLLAMADASIGGKTAIDYAGRKNLFGIINQPKAVFCDIDFLNSLSVETISSGFAEIIKCGVIGDKKAFNKMLTCDLKLIPAIKSALKVKSKLVGKDETDEGDRRLLNLGHTFAHAIESLSDFNISHGEAVASGMLISAEISEKLGISKDVYEKIKTAVNNYGLKGDTDFDREKILERLLSDKKIKGDKIVLVLPVKIGECKIFEFTYEKLREVFIER